MTENENKLLNKFLLELNTEVKDDKFSERVMRKLPNQKSNHSFRWMLFMSILGVVFFFALDGMKLWINIFNELLNSNLLIILRQTNPIQLGIAFIILITWGIKRISSLE